jgi:hypothetical protein
LDGKKLKFVAFLAFLTLLGLLLRLRCTFLLAVNDQSGPGLLLIPFEACEDWGFKLIIGLYTKLLALAIADAIWRRGCVTTPRL